MKFLKTITLLLLTVWLVSLPFDSVSAATNHNQLIKQAENKGKVLKWAISIEGSGDGKTRPWKQYNEAKEAYQKAVDAIEKSKPANKQELLSSLDEQVNTHIVRAMYYIDAITAGEKITEQKLIMQRFIEEGNVTLDLEANYHALSAEIRKQGILLDRVYGQSTRDLIRSHYKYSAEEVLNSIKYTITVKMKIDELTKLLNIDIKEGAVARYNEITSLLPLVENDSFYTQLNTILLQLAEKIDFEKNPTTPSPEKVELSIAEIKEALTIAANTRNIPPEILKGIALTENGSLRQFNADGTPLISFDGGIGIMQVTLAESDTRYDRERLKYDTRYNIEIGADILIEKWNYGGKRTPNINNNEMNILENWYFAIMAYNGLSSRNDPNTSLSTYQGRVHNNIFKYTGIKQIGIPLGIIDITYENGKQLFTNKMNYQTETFTKSKQQFKQGDILTLTSKSNFRSEPNTNSTYETISVETTVEVLGGPFEDGNLYNLFSWYNVRIVETGQVGYVASLNLQ